MTHDTNPDDGSAGSGAGAIFSGTTWYAAWLFTIGIAQLSFWQAAFALAIWPYYLGVALP